MIKPILAKSNGETLGEHTRSCLQIFRQLKEIYPDLDTLTKYPPFYLVVFQSLYLHDIGKSSIEFQKNLIKQPNFWKHYRHEILSTPFANLLNANEVDMDIIKALILTHHKDLKDLYPYYETDNFFGTTFSEYVKTLEPNVENINLFVNEFNQLAKEYGYTNLSISSPPGINKFNKEDWESTLKGLSSCLKQNEDFKNWFIFIGIFGKGMVNASDYLASGGIREILKPLPDIIEIFNFEKYTSIQERCMNSNGDTIIISPTGSGKTEAALFWATNNLNRTKGSRIFFTLPYTASINALYRRLRDRLSKYYSTEDFISLLHGRAAYFLSQMYEDQNTSRHLTKISRQICSPYKVLTPFQIIRHFFSIKGYEMGLLEMYQGLIILDEIHSYEPKTVALILGMCSYLKKNLNAKILLMSATLPAFIKTLFQDKLGITNIIEMNKDELTPYLRHKSHILKGSIYEYLTEIQKAINDNKRVLVVCNTVNQAQEIFKKLQVTNDNSSLLLHSKFILKDRERIETKIIADEKVDDIKLKQIKLLVGTQVIEVSLDINYDVCFTEPAPIDALIQRFGRVNRRMKNGICPVYVFSKGSENDKYIYNPEIVEKTLNVLQKMDMLYEWELQKAVDEVYSEGFGDKKEEFESTYRFFNDILEEIIPFNNYDRKESEFYKLFDSIEAIPVQFLTDVKEALEDGDYLEVMKYTLPLTKGQYYRLKSENRIYSDSNNLFIDVKYDNEFGLLISEKTSSIE